MIYQIVVIVIVGIIIVVLPAIDNKCHHKYEIVEDINIIDYQTNEKEGVMYISRCTECGKIKTKRVR